MPKVIHFEISAKDATRATKFYEKVFGWQVNKYGPMDYWLVNAGDDKEMGINGAISGESRFKGTINTINVKSYEDAVKKIIEAGGKIITPKSAVQGIGYMSYCKDTEGNVFGIMQTDPNAK